MSVQEEKEKEKEKEKDKEKEKEKDKDEKKGALYCYPQPALPYAVVCESNPDNCTVL
jgi:hypothetical protein